VGENLRQPAIDILLEFRQLLLLFGVQIQLLLDKRRQDLAGLRRTSEATSTARTAAAAPTRAAGATAPGTAAPAGQGQRLLVGARRGDEDLVPPDDRRRPTSARNL